MRIEFLTQSVNGPRNDMFQILVTRYELEQLREAITMSALRMISDNPAAQALLDYVDHGL
jgi:hypothetical protein